MGDDIMEEDIVVVKSPEDTVEAYTKERKKIPSIKFTYHPMGSSAHARYLDEIKRSGESVLRHQQVNYKMLAKQVVDVYFVSDEGNKIDVSKPEDWGNVPPEIVLDIASIVAGLSDEVAEAEEKDRSDL